MDTLSRFSTPLAIVIAGALVAGAVFYVNSNKTPADPSLVVSEKIRGIQADDHVLGNPDAEVVIVEFSDTECPFCKVFHETMRQIISEYGDDGKVAWVYRHLPLPSLHPKAPKEAEALECAAAQGGNETFWTYTNTLYERTDSNNSLDIGVYNTPSPTPTDENGQPYYAEKTPRSTTDAGVLSDIAKEIGLDLAAFEQCLADGTYANRVETDANEALAAGQNNPQFGTPFSVIIHKRDQLPLSGAQPIDVVRATIQSLLGE